MKKYMVRFRFNDEIYSCHLMAHDSQEAKEIFQSDWNQDVILLSWCFGEMKILSARLYR